MLTFHRSFLSAAALTSLLMGASAIASVSIDFVDHERFTDLGDHPGQYDRNLEILKGSFVDNIGPCLAEGERVEITVHNVDLAGFYQYWRPGPGVREMRDIDLPRIDLQYTHFSADGTIIAEGSERVADLNYLHRGTQRRVGRPETLRYEKDMIQRWSKKTFCDD